RFRVETAGSSSPPDRLLEALADALCLVQLRLDAFDVLSPGGSRKIVGCFARERIGTFRMFLLFETQKIALRVALQLLVTGQRLIYVARNAKRAAVILRPILTMIGAACSFCSAACPEVERRPIRIGRSPTRGCIAWG